jgi:hypothetical protein
MGRRSRRRKRTVAELRRHLCRPAESRAMTNTAPFHLQRRGSRSIAGAHLAEVRGGTANECDRLRRSPADVPDDVRVTDRYGSRTVLRNFRIMGDDQDRTLEGLMEIANELQYLDAAAGVEIAGGLIG